MSILIKGMKMPKTGKEYKVVIITDDGVFVMSETDGKIIYDAIEIPDGHGRLIDADELYSRFIRMANVEWNQKCGGSWADGFMESASILEEVPTLIPSDKDGEE